jgi:hypothetical protein
MERSYSSHDDEFPRSQIQALHPGGRWYPEQNSPSLASTQLHLDSPNLEMSGAVAEDAQRISAEDFEGKYEENPMLGRRFSARAEGA